MVWWGEEVAALAGEEIAVLLALQVAALGMARVFSVTFYRRTTPTASNRQSQKGPRAKTSE